VPICQHSTLTGMLNMVNVSDMTELPIVDLWSFSSVEVDAEVNVLGKMPQRPRYVLMPTGPILIKNARKIEELGYVAEPSVFNHQDQEASSSSGQLLWRNNDHKLVLLAFKRDDKWKPDRGKALDALSGRQFIFHAQENLSWEDWVRSVQSHDFVVCPHGHGLDTHRHWEVLLLGSVPIVKSSPLDEMFRDLPVLILAEWGDLTVHLLREWQASEASKNHINAALFPYWHKKLIEAKKEALKFSAQLHLEDA
jgi:hypothetical protein